MKRGKLFGFSLLTSYLTVSVVGLLLAIRPWNADSTEWISQHSQVWVFYLLVLQIPGAAPLMWGLFMSIFEPAFFAIATYICISTWKNVGSLQYSNKLAKLGRMSFTLLLVAIFYRLVLLKFLNPFVGQIGDPYDLRNPAVSMTWINFESTLMLAMVIVHLTLLVNSRKAIRLEK
jgi:hypothetical protein